MTRWLLTLSALLLSGCSVVYKNSICAPEKRVDVPNIEGTYSLQWMDQKFLMNPTSVTIARDAKGTYSVESVSDRVAEYSVRTCVYNNQYTAEIKVVSPDESPYFFLAYLKRLDDGSLSLVPTGADSPLLKSIGVPFEIIDPSTKPNEQKQKFLLIDNSQLSPDGLLQILDPTSLSVVLIPSSN